jgi:hypothetical protein
MSTAGDARQVINRLRLSGAPMDLTALAESVEIGALQLVEEVTKAVNERDRYRKALEQVAYGGHQRGCGALASCGCREAVAIAALEITPP